MTTTMNATMNANILKAKAVAAILNEKLRAKDDEETRMAECRLKALACAKFLTEKYFPAKRLKKTKKTKTKKKEEYFALSDDEEETDMAYLLDYQDYNDMWDGYGCDGYGKW